ncbi:MAG: DUF4197 domain-containing protein [Syntrophales bacterium]|nr:DUF4197 domain-containing protein [Syntrophales bacterium]
MKLRVMILSFFMILMAANGQAGLLGDFIKGLSSPGVSSPDAQTTASGLKEALTVGAEKAVGLLSREDGYFENHMVKILVPKQIQKVADVLVKVGYRQQVDEFVLSMNRAAEAAAPQAKDIFVSAVRQMTFEEAINILRGDQTAATEYLKSKTYSSLADRFNPIIAEAMDNYDVTRRYESLIGTYSKTLPFINLESLDLNRYVTNKALDGVFYMIGEEEKEIRANPAARVTDLLKTVFGG